MANKHISPASVDFLQNILSLFKNAGGPPVVHSLSSDIGGLTVHKEDAYLKNEYHFLEGMHNLTQLREARQTLLHLLSFVESTQDTLRSAMRPAVLARGVERLPDEILSYILVLAAGRQGWRMALWLSWVSRRFRAVALATPHLWSSLPPSGLDDLSREAMMCFLERSKTVGLTVELPLMITEEYESNPEWPEMVDLLMAHQHRWKELVVDLAAALEENDENDENAAQNRPRLTFPKASLDSVEHLVIADSAQRFLWPHYGGDYEWYDDASLDFYPSWTFPNLKSLRTEAHIPPPNVLPNLVEFSLDLSSHDVPGFADPDSMMEGLANFLNSQPALKTFKLFVGEYGYPPVNESITLPELTTLHLENNSYVASSIRTLKNISQVLWISKVNSISLSLAVENSNVRDLAGRRDKVHWIRAFFPQGIEFVDLKNFHLTYRTVNSISSTLVSDAEWFPNLGNIEITTQSAPAISGLLKQQIRGVSNLETIRYKDVHPGQETVVREYEFLGEDVSSATFFEDELLDTD